MHHSVLFLFSFSFLSPSSSSPASTSPSLMSNYPNDRGYNTTPIQGGHTPPPRMPPRLGAGNGGPVNDGYQPQSSYSPAPPAGGQHNQHSPSAYGQPAPRMPPQQQRQPAFQPQPSRKMRATRTSSEHYAVTNYVVASPQDFSSQTRYIMVDHQFVFSIK